MSELPQHDGRGIGIATALFADYAAHIDADELEAWPDFFTDQGRYKITTAFNLRRNLPIGIIDAKNRNMLVDRVAALRHANIYERQSYRHIISAIRILRQENESLSAEAGFMVVRTLSDGDQSLFATGRYAAEIDFRGPRPLFTNLLVVLDSEKIDTLLAIPL